MKKLGLSSSLLAIAIFSSTLHSQDLLPHHTRHRFLLAPASVYTGGQLGFVNPANLATLDKAEARVYWSTKTNDAISLNDWGAFLAVKRLGFGVFRQKAPFPSLTEYRLWSGFGEPNRMFGIGYSWASGDQVPESRQKILTLSTIIRPSRFFSASLIGNVPLNANAPELIGELGWRPFGTSRLTLFADGALQKDDRLSDAAWSVGAAVEAATGVHLVGRAFDDETYTVGLSLSFGKQGIASQAHFDGGDAFQSYQLRTGGMKPYLSLERRVAADSYLRMEMKGTVKYQKYLLLDSSTLRLLDILQDIRVAADDPRLAVIAMNLSGMRVAPEHAWEIREELRQAQEAGKKVIIFIDNARLSGYHLASVADHLVMDPQGSMTIEGFALGKTYFLGALEKLGLGFDEWRFFKYKSAAERLSRENMSEADREQLQSFVDDWYESARQEICTARDLSTEEFDRLVDEEIFLSADKAQEAGLVDTLARWSEIQEVFKHFGIGKLARLESDDLLGNALMSDRWSPRPRIALVYAVGVCALDEGIKARRLERVLLRLSRDESIKAVVFRVDSPGGDGLASDLVAMALEKCSRKKPVIVSQGQVAASGGYWISMYGDEILAAPMTTTGSIGVIGGWIYDKGFGDKIGLSGDFVKRGEHADLGTGIRLPLLGATIPARNLTDGEREKVEFYIKKFYDNFVAKVAEGREMPESKVRDYAQGRVFSGRAALDRGLVDQLGGMMTAIALAKERAGLAADEEIEIVEIPRRKGLIRLGNSRSIQSQLASDPIMQLIRMLADSPGQPLPVLQPGMYPAIEE